MQKVNLTLSMASVLAGSLLGSNAAAQSTASPTPSAGQEQRSEDIVVTAQRREQTLIDVAQSVSVIGQEMLERQQANTFSDYLNRVPGLQLIQSTPGEGRLIIRGLNTGGVSSTVSVYQDETPFGSSSGLANGAVLAGDFDTFDVARIEVLRGPQGTLYGASSLGGVLKFVTNAPSTEKIEGRTRAGIETTRGGDLSYVGNAMINIPLGKTLAFRASGVYRDNGGWINSLGRGGSRVRNDINTSRVYGGRASLLFKPDEKLSIRLNGLIQNIETDAPTVEESDAVTLKTENGRPTQSIFVSPYRNIAYRLYNGTINYDFGFAELLSSSSYSTQKQTRREDLTTNLSPTIGLVFQVPATGATPARFLANELYQAQKVNLEKYTQEVRLSSSGESMLDWMLGGYYTHEKGLIRQEFVAVTPGTLTPITTLPAGSINLLAGGIPVSMLPGLILAQLPSVYEEYAGFANATLHLGEHFDLDFGGRYSHNNQSVTQSLGGALAGPDSSFQQSSSENVFTYSVAPKIKFGKNASIYARVAKGFRPGGPNAQAPGTPDSTRSYKSDSTINYEVGVKAETLDRTFGIELAAFRIDWDDVQLLSTILDQNGTPFSFNGNGGKARSEGVELTATARPINGLQFSLNGAITDARLTKDAPAASGFSGDKLPFSPRYSISVNGDYSWDVGTNAEAYIGGSIRSLSKQRGPFDEQYITVIEQRSTIPAYDVVDLRAGIDFGHFSVGIFVKNLTDADGKLSVTTLNLFPATPDGRATVGTGMIRPRTFGATIGANF